MIDQIAKNIHICGSISNSCENENIENQTNEVFGSSKDYKELFDKKKENKSFSFIEWIKSWFVSDKEEVKETKEIQSNKTIEKKSFKTKRECFNLIVNSQNATGEFMNVESFIEAFDSFDYKNYNIIIIQTYFIVELLQIQFKEFKIEWKLLVKKANQWLEKQSVEISNEMKQKIMNLIHSISF